jgi:hypothetical protein
MFKKDSAKSATADAPQSTREADIWDEVNPSARAIVTTVKAKKIKRIFEGTAFSAVFYFNKKRVRFTGKQTLFRISSARILR